MSRFEDPVIITCSISGAVANRDQCPAIPYTPEEYAAEARRIVDEGGSMIHIHARTPDGVPSYEIEDFRAITEAILGEVDDVIINYSTGAIGVPIEKRIAYLRELRPDVAALNMGSMNYAKYSRRRKDFVFKTVFENSFDTIIAFLEAMSELGIRPEHECFDSGHVANLDPLIDMGLLEEPLQVSCVMGVTGGIRPTPRNLAHMAEQVPGGPEGPNNWGVIGISRDQWMLVAAALRSAATSASGLEDNFYLPDGEMARSNGDLIAKARQLAEDVGRRAATVAEARERLGGAGARGGGLTGALEGVRVLDLSRLLPGGFCSLLLADFGAEVLKVEDTGMGDYIRWSPPYYEGADDIGQVGALPGPQPRQALDPHQPEGGARRARCCCGSCGTTTCCSSPSAPACSTASGSATSACARRTRGSSTARSPATARTARYATAPGHDMNYLGLVGLLGLTGDARRPAGPGRRPDRRHRRRRADGGVRDPRRAARARALRRGPARRRLDGRRRAVLARRWSPRATSPRAWCRSAASSSSRAASSATARTPAATAGSRSARSSRSSGRPGAAGSEREDLIERQFEAPGVRGARRGRADLHGAHARRVAGVRLAARLLPRARARPRRGAGLGARARARDGGGARPARRRRRAPARRARQAVAARPAGRRAPARRWASTPTRCSAALGYDEARSRR